MTTSRTAILLSLCAACSDPSSTPLVDGPGPVAPATVTVRVPDDLSWLAVQNGDRGYEPVTPVGGVATFVVDDESGRFGAAIACEPSQETPVRVLQATTVETVEVHLVCPPRHPPGVLGDYAAVGCARAHVAAGNVAVDTGTPCGATAPRLLPAGRVDVVGIGLAEGHVIDRAVVARDVVVAESGAPLFVDFADGMGSAAAISSNVTLPPSDSWRMTFHTDRARLTIAGFGSVPYPGIPASLRRPSDIHEVCASHTCAWMRQPRDVDLREPAEPRVTLVDVTRDQAMVHGAQLGFRVELDAWVLDVSPGWQRRMPLYSFPRLCEVAGFPRPCLAATTATAFRALVALPAEGFTHAEVVRALDRVHADVPDGLRYGVARFSGPLK